VIRFFGAFLRVSQTNIAVPSDGEIRSGEMPAGWRSRGDMWREQDGLH